MATFRRYLLYQIPGWLLGLAVMGALVHLVRLPAWIAVLALALLIAKDLLVYPLVRKAYAPAEDAMSALAGTDAVAIEALSPEGYVRVRGELWRARAAGDETIPAGVPVRVESVEGMTLRVRPVSRESTSDR